VSSMLDPEVQPSPAREIVHKGKGCLAVIVAAAVLIFGGYFVWDKATGLVSAFGEVPDYPGPGNVTVTIDVPSGSSLDVIGGILIDADVVKSTKAWDQAVRSEERAQSVQAGSYVMKRQMRAIDALRLLINPGTSRVQAKFTVPEGLRLSAQVDVLAKGTKIKKSNFQTALKRPQNLGLPKYAKNRPEGFLFPDTYYLTAESTATSTMQQMVSQYKTVAKDIQLDASAKKLKRSPYEVLIVASIIEREVRREEDRANVARVIYNRLAKDMRLQMDSTVTYAEKLTGTTTSKRQRLSRSPYNTYRYKGLPPGPISAPGKAALQAAGQPEAGKWLYFVTVNLETGETKFAQTDAEFKKLVAEFQSWCQANTGRCVSK
jgi:UPF0755 protein